MTELTAFEAGAASAVQDEADIRVDALREMARDFRHVGMAVAAELCDEKAAAIEASA